MAAPRSGPPAPPEAGPRVDGCRERPPTAPHLKGLWTYQKGGFLHDGRFPTLEAVVAHYDTFFALGLTAGEKRDLVEYVKSL